jgi:hypothetical protein
MIDNDNQNLWVADGSTKTATNGHVAPQPVRPKIKFRNVPAALEKRRLALLVSYCRRTAAAARFRAKKAGVPCDLNAHDLEEILSEQNYRCAVSDILLETPPFGKDRRFRQIPFGPSLDRIIPAKGYVRGNVRITCSIVNMAMNEWGLEALLRVVAAMSKK